MSEHPDAALSRRTFLKTAGTGLVAAGLLGEIGGQAAPPITPPASPATQPIALPPFTAPTEKQPDKPPLPLPLARRLGIAVVGLGNLALTQVIPALGQTNY